MKNKTAMKNNKPEASILAKCREMILLLNIHLNHFPKHEKYGLSQSIRQAAYGVYEMLVECQKRYHNKTTLSKLDVRHEQLRMLINLAFELGYYNYDHNARGRSESESRRRYVAISLLVNELGAMIGGWIRSEKAANGVGA